MSALGVGERWARLAGGPCPAPDDLLLTAAELTGDPAVQGTREALDEQSRRLFAASGRVACATLLTAVLELELGYRADARERPELLSLTRVVRTRVGHPLLLSVLGVALLRRAGHAATVCFADGRWLAAACGTPLVIIDTLPGARPERVRPVCGHLAGFAALSALRRALDEDGQVRRAAEVDRLLGALPIEAPR